MNRKEKKFIAIFTDSEKGMLHMENTYTNKNDFKNDLKQVGYKKIRIFAESEIKEIIGKYWSIEMPKKYIKTTYDCEVIEYIYETFRNATEEQAEEQEAVPAEETARSTKNSAEEITEEPETEEQEAVPAEETARNTKNSVFRYKINILEVLKESGYTSTRIRKEKLFAQVTLQKFRTGDTNISLQTVADICNLTGLQPWDILSFSGKTAEEPEAEELETEPAEETARSTKNSAEEITEEPEAEEQEAVPAEETARNTKNSAEEETEEITEKFLNSILIDVETEIAKLPDLFETGSKKQIAWAENIRRNAYMYLNNIITNAVILGYDENRKPIYIDSERYKNGTEYNIDGNYYNSKKIIDSVMQVKQGVLDRYFMEMCQTAPKIIENRCRIENKELRRYTTNCYKHM